MHSMGAQCENKHLPHPRYQQHTSLRSNYQEADRIPCGRDKLALSLRASSCMCVSVSDGPLAPAQCKGDLVPSFCQISVLSVGFVKPILTIPPSFCIKHSVISVLRKKSPLLLHLWVHVCAWLTALFNITHAFGQLNIRCSTIGSSHHIPFS